jgi:guanylate kinase
VQLQHYQEFKDVLEKYQVSPRAQRAIADLKLVLMLAPTSGGRNTIIKHQIDTGRYYYIISDTTRPPRKNDGVMEQNGKEYWFRSEEELLADVDVEGIHNVVRAKPDTVTIMLLPPSFEEWQRRLSSRGQMRPDELKRRMQTAQKILEDGLQHDYYHFIISEDIGQSSAIIDAVVEGKPNPHQGRGRGLIEHLQSSLSDKLTSMY